MGSVVASVQFQIVSAGPADMAGIAAVHVRAWQAAYAGILMPGYLASLSIAERTERWREILAVDDSTTLVARKGGQVIAFASFGKWRSDPDATGQGEVQALYVDPPMWRLGVGRALLRDAVAGLRAAGRANIGLWVLAENSRGLRFYDSFGFVQVPGSEREFEIGGARVREVACRFAAAVA